jgi:hypothetical protein
MNNEQLDKIARDEAENTSFRLINELAAKNNTIDLDEYYKGVIDGGFECFKSGYNYTKWVSVEDVLPNDGESVLVSTLVGGISNCFIRDNKWRYSWNSNVIDDLIVITHWQPLPSTPTK